MELFLDIGASGSSGHDDSIVFPLVGLWIECASWNANEDRIDISGSDGTKSDVMKSQLPTCQLRWGLLTDHGDNSNESQSQSQSGSYLKIPVYSNSSRCHRLFDVRINVTSNLNGNGNFDALATAWLQRGIAIVTQGLD